MPRGDLLEGDAAELFLSLVRRVRAGYIPKGAEAAVLSELVRELDGLPLALQLAAPRLAMMGPAVLLHRLRTSRSMLRAHAADEASPHRSFDAAMTGSWQALEAWERDALTQLTVFRGGMSAEDAEAVIDISGTAGAPPPIEVLQALRDKSLLASRTVDDGQGTVRLEMLGGVRDFVVRHGDQEVQRLAAMRHAAHFGHLAGQWRQQMSTARGQEARRAVTADQANLLALIRSVVGAGPVTPRAAEPALRALIALSPAHPHQSPPWACATLIEPVLDATHDSGADPLLVGRVLVLRGASRRIDGRIPAAMKDLVRALTVARTMRANDLEGSALFEIGRVLLDKGDYPEARKHLLRALEKLREAGAKMEEASALVVLGDIESRSGELAQAQAVLDRAAALYTSAGEGEAEAVARCALARALVDASDYDASVAQLESARRAAAGDPATLSLCDLAEGMAAHDRGELQRAVALYERTESASRSRGLEEREAIALALRAIISVSRGQLGDAHALLRASSEAMAGPATSPFLGVLRAAAPVIDRIATPALAIPPPQRTTADALDPAIGLLDQLASDPASWPKLRSSLWDAGSRRCVVRIVFRALDQAFPTASPKPVLPPDALVVGATGGWFRLPDGESCSLERRRPLARILLHLARARERAPGAASSWLEVQEAGWPGERMIASAGAHRVRVAISTMRKLGLRDLVKTVEDGYLLDASCPIAIAEN